MSGAVKFQQRSLAEIAPLYDSDKAEYPNYLRNYEENFRPFLDKDIRLFELGVRRGGSLQIWRDYFARGLIVGLDINPVALTNDVSRIRIYQGPQENTALLDQIASETAPDGFDIIIDDCAHIGVLARVSFWHLFDKYLKPGGLYVIEDWGSGYWENWVDGVRYSSRGKGFNKRRYRTIRALSHLQQKRWINGVPLLGSMIRRAKAATVKKDFRGHDYGMAGFVKELVDELGTEDTVRGNAGTGLDRSKFSEIRMYPSHLFVTKA
jgi:23S rRNA U2552 (ribose-2'-O)-methylase RlmE/FtsJ